MINTFKITPAKFMQNSNIAGIFNAIANNGGNVKFVGGCVRDLILGKKINDIDLATNLKPEEVILALEDKGIVCLKNAIEYGTVTAIIDMSSVNAYIKKVEITSLRKDIETFGRQATVEYTKDFQEDAQRRDFTINALYADLDGTVYDFVNGYDDLMKKRLLFIGDPEQRIKEDYLRILRYFRFYATLDDMTFDDKALDACAENAESLKKLSGERIAKEFFLILASKNPIMVLELMKEEKILDNIIDVVGDFELLKNLVWLESKANINLPNVTVSHIRRLAAIIKQDKATAEKTAIDLRLSKSQTERLFNLISAPFEIFYEMEDVQIRKILHHYGAERFQDFVLLKWAKERCNENKTDSEKIEKWYDLLEIASSWRPMEFCLRGKDLIERGVQEGTMIGKILFEMEEFWQKNDFRLGREELLEELDNVVLKYKNTLR